MIKLLVFLFLTLINFNIPADAEGMHVDVGTITANQQLQQAMVNDDIDAAGLAFDSNAKFCFWAPKEGTRSQRQVNALNFVLRHFIAGGANKDKASQILTKLDIKMWDQLVGIEDGFEHQTPMEMLDEVALGEVYQLIKRIHFNSDDDEEKYQLALQTSARQSAQEINS